MRLRWKVVALALAACAFGVGAFVGTGLGSGRSSWSSVATAMPEHASPAGKLSARRGGGGNAPRIKHFLADTRSVAAGDAELVRVKCPKKFPNPITGGAFTSGPGLALMNMSRENPGGETKPRSIYVAVGNVNSTGGQDWKPEVTCGKHIKQ
jgi:hypothetical protein